MKLADLFEDETVIDPSVGRGAGYRNKSRRDKDKLSTYLLRRKAEKNNPKCGDNTKPDGTTTRRDTGDDPDELRYGAGLQ